MRQEIAEAQSANRETENRLRMEQERTQKLTSDKAKTEMALERNTIEFEKRGVFTRPWGYNNHRLLGIAWKN